MSSDSIKKNSNQLLLPYMPFPASQQVKFRNQVNVASIADDSYHPIIHDTPITIDDTKCTAGKLGSITFRKLPTKTI